MAQTRVRKAGQRGKTNGSTAGWVYMLMGLSVGLAVAYAVYVNGNKQSGEAAPEAAAASAPAEKPAASKAAPLVADEPAEEEVLPEGEVTYDFYNMLPSLDVELYGDKSAPTKAAAPANADPQGTYIIQAGSFSAFADANKRKAELGLLGIRSEIMAGDANGRTVYRVYTSELSTPDEVNRARTLLADQGIDILLKRVGD